MISSFKLEERKTLVLLRVSAKCVGWMSFGRSAAQLNLGGKDSLEIVLLFRVSLK